MRIEPPAPKPLSRDDLLGAFVDLKRKHAVKRERSAGETITEGDEVLIDVVAYDGGHVVPSLVQGEFWLWLTGDRLPPRFGTMIGSKVGESIRVRSPFSEDELMLEVQGRVIDFDIAILRAVQVTLPKDDDPEFLRAMRRGTTLVEIMRTIKLDLERDRAAEAMDEARELVIDALAAAPGLVVPDDAVDREIARGYKRNIAPVLERRDVPRRAADEAFARWRKNPTVRFDAERRVRATVVLWAIRTRDKVELFPEPVNTIWGALARETHTTVDEMKMAVASDPEAAAEAAAVVEHLAMLQYVLDRAVVMPKSPAM